MVLDKFLGHLIYSLLVVIARAEGQLHVPRFETRKGKAVLEQSELMYNKKDPYIFGSSREVCLHERPPIIQSEDIRYFFLQSLHLTPDPFSIKTPPETAVILQPPCLLSCVGISTAAHLPCLSTVKLISLPVPAEKSPQTSVEHQQSGDPAGNKLSLAEL